MAERALTTLLLGGAFFEGPRWHDGCWWLSDFYRHGVYRVASAGHEELVLEVPGQPSGIGWLPDGSMLVASMRDHRVLRRTPGGAVTVHAELGDACTGVLNDMVVDRAGRAWVGDFGFDLMAFDDPVAASLKRVDPDGTVTVVARDLQFPNGMVISDDGTTLVVAETLGNRFTSFRIDASGGVSGRRVWGQMGPEVTFGPAADTLEQLRVAVDGCTLDAEDCIWGADGIGSRCVRVAPGGEIVDEIRAPEGLGIYACMLGGDDGRTLLLCSAPDYFEANRRDTREAVLLTTTVEVPHAGLP